MCAHPLKKVLSKNGSKLNPNYRHHCYCCCCACAGAGAVQCGANATCHARTDPMNLIGSSRVHQIDRSLLYAVLYTVQAIESNRIESSCAINCRSRSRLCCWCGIACPDKIHRKELKVVSPSLLITSLLRPNNHDGSRGLLVSSKRVTQDLPGFLLGLGCSVSPSLAQKWSRPLGLSGTNNIEHNKTRHARCA